MGALVSVPVSSSVPVLVSSFPVSSSSSSSGTGSLVPVPLNPKASAEAFPILKLFN